MISNRELKYYSSLLIKKFRSEEQKFLVEGVKIVEEGLDSSYDCEAVFVTPAFMDSAPEILNKINSSSNKLFVIKSAEFQRISDTKSPQGIAAVFLKPEKKIDINQIKDNRLVFLDNISDPGNLGTIFRTCDWLGFKIIFLSPQSVEYLNPKVIRASMGSVFHLNIYDNIAENDLVKLRKTGYKLICSDLDGKNIFEFKSDKKFIITFSNESSGPSEELKKIADTSVTIPKRGKAESLNVSSAAAIILSHLAK